MFKLNNKTITRIFKIIGLVVLLLHYMDTFPVPYWLKNSLATVIIFCSIWIYALITIAIVALFKDKNVHKIGEWYYGVIKKRTTVLKSRNTHYVEGYIHALTMVVVLISIVSRKYDLLSITLLAIEIISIVLNVLAKIVLNAMYVCKERANILTMKDNNKYLNELRNEYLAINDLLVIDGAFSCKEGLKEVKEISKYYYQYID